MSDWEIYAPDEATMIRGGVAMGLLAADQSIVSALPVTKIYPNATRIDVNFYGRKVLTAATFDAEGHQLRPPAYAPGVYAIMRFTPGPGQPEFDPATHVGPGCKVVSTADPSFVQGANEPVWG